MTRIVRNHYPVDKLPEDLRKHFSRGGLVTLEVKEEPKDAERPVTASEVASMLRAAQERNKASARSMEEIVAEVRDLRDEWDD
ncbi:MAG TPA: hypothetical protein VNS12_08620 [Pelagibacterium sp.]|uniref:hypothetical protein n=1 Tax=Pelagibacterium sp. TaxID=1967288 RepID=UPI002CF26EBF|nr:hypothetical protein [Pelagibacterium sp.]HWJ88118.1 hypothetical protein [Pelagibacterium sp.]